MNSKQQLAYLPRRQQIWGVFILEVLSEHSESLVCRRAAGGGGRAGMNKATAPFVKCLKVFACSCARARAPIKSSRDAKLCLEGALGGFDVRREDLTSAWWLLGGGAEASPAARPINQLSTPRHFGDNKNSSNPVNGLRVC